MRGLYLYCLRERGEAPEPLDAPGIDGVDVAHALPFRDLEAVVSEVSLDEFTSEQVRWKAREDIAWIKEKGLAHQRVIARAWRAAGRAASVIPMPFGVVYTNRDTLEAALSGNYASLRRLLDKLRGKEEWSVKVYVTDRAALDRVVIEADPRLQEKKRELERLPEGMAFLLQEEVEEAVARERKVETLRLREQLSKALSGVASESRPMDLLGKEITGRDEPMALNTAWLVEKESLAAFQVVASRWRRSLRPKGLSLECTGPLPPFSFSRMEET